LNLQLAVTGTDPYRSGSLTSLANSVPLFFGIGLCPISGRVAGAMSLAPAQTISNVMHRLTFMNTPYEISTVSDRVTVEFQNDSQGDGDRTATVSHMDLSNEADFSLDLGPTCTGTISFLSRCSKQVILDSGDRTATTDVIVTYDADENGVPRTIVAGVTVDP
jgi:hypothetical protein